MIRDLTCPGPGGDDRAAALRRARDARAGAAFPVPPWRRLRVRRPRHPRAVLRRDGARSSTCRCSRSTIGWRPEHPWPAGVEDAIAAARWAAASPAALGARGDRAGRLPATAPAAISPSSSALALRDEPAAVPVLAQWPIYPAADPGKGYPSKEDFGEGYLLTRAEHGLVRANAIAPTSGDWRYAPAGQEPGRDAADPGRHRQPRSDPRPGPGLCRRLHPGRRADHLPRGRGQYPRLHQSAAGDPLLGRRRQRAASPR